MEKRKNFNTNPMTARPSLFRAFGRKWKKSHLDRFREMWEDPRFVELAGNAPKSGVYVLLQGITISYVGLAKDLYIRLFKHTTNHLKDDWDGFHWFICEPGFEHDLEALLHYALFDFKRKEIKTKGLLFAPTFRKPRNVILGSMNAPNFWISSKTGKLKG